MQAMNANGMQVIVLNLPGQQNDQLSPRNTKPCLAKQLIGLGVMHALIGISCIIFHGISLGISTSQNQYAGSITFLGYGFCYGLFLLINGIIGITAGIRKSSCQIVAFNILSIISAATIWIMISLAALSVIYNIVIRRQHLRFNEEMTEEFYEEMTEEFYEEVTVEFYEEVTEKPTAEMTDIYQKLTTMLIMEAMISVMGILEGIIAIWSSIVCCLIGVCSCCRASSPQTQPMIISAEQQAALMSNPMFMSNQQQSTVGFYPQQQTVQYSKQQSNAAHYPHNNFMPAATVENAYTGLNTGGMRRNLPSVNVDESTCNTSVYEELHEYDEIGL